MFQSLLQFHDITPEEENKFSDSTNRPGLLSKRLIMPFDKSKFKLNLKNNDSSNSVTAQPPPPEIGTVVDPSGKILMGTSVVMDSHGVSISNTHYSIALEQFDFLESVGKGQYGEVWKVYHRPTAMILALKEIRLDISEAGMKQIIMELDVLHRAKSPFIVGFFGSFFTESSVYHCMEYLDAGSLDRWMGKVPENVLSKIADNVIRGLLFLKDELQIIHRDVKPTNILISTSGDIKLCDFGVSGKLIQSIAKTNIGCQSYMAPERITQGQQEYSVQSDVWSLGISLYEIVMGGYPFPVTRKDSVFAQLAAIVSGAVPSLPGDRFSPECIDFVAQCVIKNPDARPTYQKLLTHPFLFLYPTVDVARWVQSNM